MPVDTLLCQSAFFSYPHQHLNILWFEHKVGGRRAFNSIASLSFLHF